MTHLGGDLKLALIDLHLSTLLPFTIITPNDILITSISELSKCLEEFHKRGSYHILDDLINRLSGLH